MAWLDRIRRLLGLEMHTRVKSVELRAKAAERLVKALEDIAKDL